MMISFNREQPDKPVVKITALTSDESTDLKFQPLVITSGKSPPFPPAEPAPKVTIHLGTEASGPGEVNGWTRRGEG